VGPGPTGLLRARCWPVRIPVVRGSGSEVSTFTDESFEIERTSKTKPPVCLNHDKNLRVGRTAMLYRHAGWWCADFVLDDDVSDDIEFETGQPVSVGLSDMQVGTYLSEISIVRHAAVKGAEITRCFALEPKPAEADRSPAAVRASSDRAAAGEVVRDWTGHRPDELAWAEDARKRGSIVRFGAGQVLGVR
jgi:hypothetical protein